jgi:hypothetical protein
MAVAILLLETIHSMLQSLVALRHASGPKQAHDYSVTSSTRLLHRSSANFEGGAIVEVALQSRLKE